MELVILRDVQVVHETDAAVLLRRGADGEEAWFPFSQVESLHRHPDGSGSAVVTAWIARQKGWV